ncbi:uncharacterized protein METZ01_LOCUS146010, partial [marine metagenome]
VLPSTPSDQAGFPKGVFMIIATSRITKRYYWENRENIMAYEMGWHSGHPGCIIFLIDQSDSMSSNWGSTEFSGIWCSSDRTSQPQPPGPVDFSFAFGAAKAVNQILGELIPRCRKGEEILPFIRIGVYGYTGDSVEWAAPSIPPEKDGLVSISKLDLVTEEFLDTENESFIPWIVKEQANGGRPMRAAFEKVTPIARNFALNHPDSFPPIIVNITNGPPTDCDRKDLPDIVTPVKNIETSDGATLVFNIHLSAESSASVWFPNINDSLPDVYAENLLAASSTLPELFPPYLEMQSGWNKISDGAKCLTFNADFMLLIRSTVVASCQAGIHAYGGGYDCDECGSNFMTENLLNRHKDDVGH